MKITPTNDFFELLWHLKVMKAEEAWYLLRSLSATEGVISGHSNDKTFGSANVYMAIIDMGLQETGGNMIATDFQGNVTNGNPKGGPFYDFSTTTAVASGGLQFQNADNANIKGGHGMNCAGVAGAKASYADANPSSTDYVGGAVVGVAPNCPIIGIIDLHMENQYIWLLNVDLETIQETLAIPTANLLSNVAPFNSGNFFVDVISASLSYKDTTPARDATSQSNARRIGFLHTVYGRGGRGTFLVTASGNDGKDTANYQNLSYSPRFNIVGATALPNGVTAPFHLNDELKSSFSNYGDEVHFVAPAGDTISGREAYQIITTALHDGGTMDEVPDFIIEINNDFTDGTRLRVEVTSTGGCRGLFAGQYITTQVNPIETLRILEVDEVNKHIWIENFNTISRPITATDVAVSTKYTELASSNPNPSSTKINVDDIEGFKNGQRIYVGDTSGSGNGQFATIASISGNEITIDSSGPDGALSNTYTSGKSVIAGECSSTVSTDTTNTHGTTLTLPMASSQGFYKGQVVLLSGTFEIQNPSGYTDTPYTELSNYIADVNVGANTIDIMMVPGPWRTIRAGLIVKGIGFGDYNTKFSGTSAACPMVTGAACLLYSAHPDLSWLEVRELLSSTADKLDLDNTNTNGRWKDKDGNNLFSGTGSMDVQQSGKSLASAANNVDEITLSPDHTNFTEGMVIKVGSGGSKEYAIILEVLSGNKLKLDRTLRNSHSGGTTVKGGYVAYRSDYYGRGRINLERAVAATIDYKNNNYRDLMIRDAIGSDGVTATDLSTTKIDSPDIWVRNIQPDIDGANAIPPDDLNPTHQNPGSNNSRWIYIRVKNQGTDLASLEGSQLHLSFLFTDSSTDPFPMPFPEYWGKNQTPAATGFNVKLLNISPSNDDLFPASFYTAPTQVMFENTALTNGDWQQPHLIPSLIPGEEYIAVFPWPGYIGPPNKTDRTFIRAHISPFDGSLAGSNVEDNHHLTYKEITFANIELFDPANASSELIEVEVSTAGTVITQNISLHVSQLEPSAVDRITITATMKFADGSPDETVIFSKPGASWAFDTSPTWMTLNSPVLSGSSTPFQELTIFSGNLALSNTNGELTFLVKTTESGGSTLLERTMTLTVKPNLPKSAGGIGRQQTKVMQTFTDFDALPIQSGSNNFGPISNTQFRTSAMFSGVDGGATELKAFAVTSGNALLQEVDGEPDLVNIILKPDVQNYLPYGKVKYFVYRGILKSGFIDSATGDVIAESPSNNELLARMWEIRNSLNTEEKIANPSFVDLDLIPADLGIGALSETTGLDEVFEALISQRISKGWHIGDFEIDSGKEYGFTVIVDNSTYAPILKDVRSLDHIIEITYDSGQPEYGSNQEEDIKTKVAREQCLSYLDPASYFGLQGLDKIDIIESGSKNELNDVDDVYTRILSKFATHDKLYLDIRNELNYSLNFYGNYGDGGARNDSNVEFLDASATTVPKTYGTNGWPILVLDKNDFPANSTDDSVLLQLALPTGDNSDPVLYLEGTSFKSDFPDNLLKFELLTSAGTYSNTFDIGILNNPAQSVVMPGAFKVNYCKRYDTSSLPTVSFPSSTIIKDDLIDTLLVDANIPMSPILDHVVWNSLTELRYNGWTSRKGIDYTLQTGKALDGIGMILFAYVTGPAELGGETTQARTHSSMDIDIGKFKGSCFYQYLKTRKVIKPIQINTITRSSSTNVDCPLILSVRAGFEIDILQRSANDLITMACTEAEKVTIEGLMSTFLEGTSKYFSLINHKLEEDDNKTPYFEMELAIQGIEYNSSAFSHEVKRVSSGIMFYSFDGRNYFTEDYTSALSTQLPF